MQNQIETLIRLRKANLVPGVTLQSFETFLQNDELLESDEGSAFDTGRFERIEKPDPSRFPLLAFHPDHGWGVASDMVSDREIRFINSGQSSVVDQAALTSWALPAELDEPENNDLPADKISAKSIIVGSLLKRKKVFVTAIVATIFANILALITSLYSMQIYDRVIPRSGYETLIALTVGAALGLLFDFVLRSTRSLMMEREAARVDEEVSDFFFDRTQSIKLEARPKSVGTLASQLRGLEQIRGLLSSTFLFLVADLPFALFFIAIIYMLGGIIFLVPLIGFPLSIGLAFFFAKMIKKDTDRAQVTGNRKNGLLVEALDGAETLKANGGNMAMLGKWSSLVREVHKYEDPIKRTTAVASSIFGSIQQLSYILLIAFGAFQVTLGEMTIGALIACGIIAGRVNGPLIAMLPQLIVQSGYARSSMAALDMILDLPNEKDDLEKQLRPDSVHLPLRLENIAFSYGDEPPVLRAPLLEVHAGERVVVVGGIGSGKTTLLKIMAGLYGPSEGRALLGGLEVGQIAPHILRDSIGYIPQDPRLINGTLKENLLMGLADPGDDAILEAAGKTGLDRMIRSHPRGLGLTISEGGKGLSGGQRMLTHLTRLMLSSPKILLLDEPTSNLDQSTEARILKAIFDSCSEDKAMILVTHKLPLIQLGTRALIMANGNIVHDSTPAETMKKLKLRIDGQPAASPQKDS